jgi:hypothetical protein
MQYASALPLARNSFEQNALAVVSGQPDEFRSRPTGYNLAPAHSYYEQLLYSPDQPRQRNRNFRAMSRADREARINDRGYGSLLSSVRRSALNGMQSDYLGQIGMAAAPARAGLARRATSGSISFLKNIGGKLDYRTGLIGASALALNPYAGSVVESVGGAKSRQAFEGFSGGAALGAGLGSAFGVGGAAIGGVAGGTLGIVKALEGFERTLLDGKIEKGFSRIEDAAGELSDALDKAGGKIDASVLAKAGNLANEQLANRQYLELAKGKSEATFSESYGHTLKGLGSGFMNLFDTTGGGFKDRFLKGYNAPHVEAERQRQQAASAKEVQNLELSAGTDSQLRSGLLGQSRKVGDFAASDMGQGIIERAASLRVHSRIATGSLDASKRLPEFEKEKVALAQQIAAEENSRLAVKRNADAIDAFARNAKAAAASVDGLNSRLADMSAAAQSIENRNAVLTGATGSGPASISNSRLSSSIGRFGSAGFEQSVGQLGRLAPETQSAGGLLMSANRAHNAISSALQ